MKVLGITGWSGSGKTTLIVALLPRLRARGLRVSTFKHAHHGFDIDRSGKDSYNHREAGAEEVLICSDQRWVLMHELRDEPVPSLDELLQRLQPVDLVLLEGWKNEPWPKLEVWRPANGKPLRFPEDDSIIAVVTDSALRPELHGRSGLPVLPLNDADAVSEFIAGWVRRDEHAPF